MNLTPLQSDFSAGEISPLMRNRTELKGFSASVERSQNMVSLPQGPSFNRFPFELLHVEPAREFGMVRTFQINANLFYIILFLDLEVKFFTDAGTPVDVGFVSNPRFSDLGLGWSTFTVGGSSLVTFVRHGCFLTPHNSASGEAGLRQQITVADGLLQYKLVIESDVGTLPNELRVRVGTNVGDFDILDDVAGTDTVEFLFTPGIASFWVEATNLGNNAGDATVTVSMIEVFDDAGDNSEVSPYQEEDLLSLHFVEDPSGDTVYIFHQNYPIQQLVYNPIAGTIAFKEAIITNPPVEWGPGNYPATGTIHRGRLYAANTKLEPEQIWASTIGDHLDFLYGANPTEAFSVVNEHYGAIEWMLSTKDLIFGSENGEYIVTSQGPVIYIGDIQIDRQSTYGSTRIQAIQVGDKVLYVTRDNKKLHGMQFNRDAQTWLSEELSFASEHLLKTGVIDLTWEHSPLSLFWMVLTDGTLACMNYNRPMGIIGWHPHDTQGRFLSTAAGEKFGNTRLVTLVNRGTGDLHLEISSGDGSPMDSRISVHNIVPSATVAGLDPLEGFEVQVIADGAVHPDRTVVGGEITLQAPAEFIQVGLGYRKYLKTLPFDKGARTGSARSFVKRYKDVFLELLSSHIPFINGQLPPIRHPVTPMNTAEPVHDGLVKISNLGFNREAPVEIEQNGPLSVAVGGIYGEVTQDKI